MGLITWGNSSLSSLETGINLAWGMQDKTFNKASLDYSVPGIRSPIDGSMKAAPSTFDISCQLISRLSDAMQRGFSALNRALTFPPIAEATVIPSTQVSTLEKCTEMNLAVVYQITESALAHNNPQMLVAAQQLYGPFFQTCFNQESHNTATQIHKENKDLHAEELKKHANKLKECKDKKGDGYCYSLKEEYVPEIFEIERQHIINNQIVTTKQWTTSSGYLSWTIYVDKFWWPDSIFASGSYNYNQLKNSPTVQTRQDITGKEA